MYITRIENKKPSKVELLVSDPDIQDILVLNLTRAVQLCVDIGSHIISETNETAPQTMGDVFTILNSLEVISAGSCEQLKKAVGFRNVAIHAYDSINWKIVYAICEKSLEEFRRFAREISTHVS